MLHEAVSKTFDRTPSGALFTKDLKIIYSLLLICLNLGEKPKKIVGFFKQYDYSFTLQEAVHQMENLSSIVESSATKTTISYSIKSDLALKLIKKFMDAKLLHTPADRTRNEPKNKVMLQPTPKGVAILQSYCKMFGLKSQSEILIFNSNFNSMDLFIFERSSITDTIIHSEYFIHLLFSRFIGPFPNVWHSSNPPDELPSLDHRVEIVDEFDFSNYQNEFKHKKVEKPIILNKKKAASRESPFHHNFFTNPDSDSHVQYYVSNKGIRLYKNFQFINNLKVQYCFNAKAAWQWLMDCTDILYPKEAILILNLFYKYGLIEPIIVSPSTATSKSEFLPLKTSIYTLSKRGLEISDWTDCKRDINKPKYDEILKDVKALTLNDSVSILFNDDELNINNEIDIKKVLKDPGMRYLFRNHLEKEYCAENLDIYMDIKQFDKKMIILESLLQAYKFKKDVKLSNNTTIKPPTKKTLVKLVNECLSLIYHIYSSYITIGSPYEINIDHLLRRKITSLMLHSSSPLKENLDDEKFEIIKLPENAHIKSNNSVDLPTLNPRTLNVKNLSIDINNDIIHNEFANDFPKTPTIEEMKKSLKVLFKLNPLIELVGKQILKMLEFDSFPKFIKSKTFLDANITN